MREATASAPSTYVHVVPVYPPGHDGQGWLTVRYCGEVACVPRSAVIHGVSDHETGLSSTSKPFRSI